MELIKCAYCGLNQIRKQADGTYICGSCGSIYQLNENKDHKQHKVIDEITDAKVLLLLNSARKCREANDTEGEIQNLIKVLELDANNTDALIKLGRSYREANMYQSAINCYQQVLALDPDEPGAYTNLATVYIAKKEYETAVKYAEIALPLYTEKNYDYVIAAANYAVALGMNGETEKAALILDECDKMGYANVDSARALIGIPC